ncbi:MAG: phosphoribosylamine--glycine ligase [Planctomycetes bacterium]|nr:phosphoribosylamine--glycine ligase [Planctomycetota bacterium]
MKILVVGSGGREHALCWKLAQSPRNPTIFCAPGNAGTRQIAENIAIAADDITGLVKFAKVRGIDLTVVGPEDPLCAGIVDRFQSAGLRIVGPTAEAAKLEGDKAFAKQLMREAGVPTGEARVFGPTLQEIAQARQSRGQREDAAHPELLTGYEMARHYISTRDEGIVVKAAGLAKGKGVFVHPEPADALKTIEDLMVNRSLGEAGQRIVVEELLIGREVSVMALVDGRTIYLLETAADHKRLGDGDKGPNTGGMGAYSPSTILSDADLVTIQRDVFVPTIDALRRDDVEYRGVLYAGLMMTAAGPKVLEFNCRFGDPETQPIMMRLKSDLVEALEATVDGRLDQIELRWDERPAVCVVMAAGGYPGDYAKGSAIHGLASADAMNDVHVFHAGTAVNEDQIVTNGGRVLGVTALGGDIRTAAARAYEVVSSISFDGAVYRRDIGMKLK